MEEEPVMDVAHLGHLELLTPKPEESLRFFVDVMGMTESGREGDSVFLRGWDDYEQLFASTHGGENLRRSAMPRFARAARRRLQRRVQALEGVRPWRRLDRRRRLAMARPIVAATPTAI